MTVDNTRLVKAAVDTAVDTAAVDTVAVDNTEVEVLVGR